MDERRSDFFATMVDILARLQHVAKDEPLLASVLSIAKGEAESALRHAQELEAITKHTSGISGCLSEEAGLPKKMAA